MPRKIVFLIRYSLDNRPCSVEVEADSEAMTADQARFYLCSIHTSASPEDITDVQIARISDPQQNGPLPGQKLQP